MFLKKDFLGSLKASAPEHVHYLTSIGMLDVALNQAIENGKNTYEYLLTLHKDPSQAEAEAGLQIHWELNTKLPYFGNIKRFILPGSIGADRGEPFIAKSAFHEFLSKSYLASSPEAYAVSISEGSLQINIDEIVFSGKSMLQTMVESGVAEEHASALVKKKMLSVLLGEVQPLDSLRDYKDSMGSFFDTPFYYIYIDIHGFDALIHRNFYNIGSGAYFHHPAWQNIDHPSAWYAQSNIDLEWDAHDGLEIDRPSGSAEAVYTSHVVEHLHTEGVQRLMEEAFRLLKKGGILRVTCPDFDRYYNAFESNDRYGFSSVPDPALGPCPEAVSSLFLYETLSQLSPYYRHKWSSAQWMKDLEKNNITLPNCFSRQDLEALIAEDGVDKAMKNLSKVISKEAHSYSPGLHANWWPFSQLKEIGIFVGFSKVIKSTYGQSESVVLRDTRNFDCTAPHISQYIDFVK